MNLSCFGIPSVFSFKSKVCAACPDFEQCREESYASLLSVESKLPLNDLLAEHEGYTIERGVRKPKSKVSDAAPRPRTTTQKTSPRALSQEMEDRLRLLPVKVETAARRILTKRLDLKMRESLARGSNPFTMTDQRYLSVALDRLLGGGFSKGELRSAYMRELGWTEGTAFSHVSMIWHLLPFFELATVSGGYLVPTPLVLPNNSPRAA